MGDDGHAVLQKETEALTLPRLSNEPRQTSLVCKAQGTLSNTTPTTYLLLIVGPILEGGFKTFNLRQNKNDDRAPVLR